MLTRQQKPLLRPLLQRQAFREDPHPHPHPHRNQAFLEACVAYARRTLPARQLVLRTQAEVGLLPLGQPEP